MAASCPFGYQTRLYDQETGLCDFGKRYYDPTTRSWLSRDPLCEEGGVNLYAYCQDDPVGNHDPIGLAEDGFFELMFPAHAGRDDLVQAAREGGLYAGYGIITAPARLATHPKVQGALRMAGGGLEVASGAAYSLGTEGFGAALGDGVLVLNGADNFNAGLQALRTGVYHPALLERGITGVAGNGIVGNGLYAATQLGAGFAPTLGARVQRLALALDWEPFFEPLRGGYTYTGVPVPGWPKFKVPSPEVFKMSLRTMPTPMGSPANLFEIANTGTLNYQIKAGGVEFWADGIIGTTIQESKFLANAERSPFILESNIPQFLRNKILGDVDGEFARMARIIADPTNPLMNVEIITNDPRANQFFLDLLKKHCIDGRVINR